MLMTSGCGLLYWQNDPEHPLPVDGRNISLYYLPSNRWRFVDICSRRPAHIIALHFELKCEDGADFPDYYTVVHDLLMARKTTFRSLMHKIVSHYRSHDFGETLECERYFRILLGSFCEALKQKDAHTIYPKPMRCQPAVAYLQCHYNQPLDMGKLTKLCRVSRPYFYALFRQETGMTSQQYLCRLRIERARRLLLFSTKSVAEIGIAVGWSDPFHFSRIFTRETGVSPAKFRKRQII
jgi:AraC-like DNA-binding protein